jgi:hypothetical protein
VIPSTAARNTGRGSEVTLRPDARGQRALEVSAIAFADKAGLSHARDERGDGRFAVSELGGANQVILHPQLIGEVMKREHPAAQAVAAHLETGAIA